VNIFILIPAYNAAKTLPDVIDRLSQVVSPHQLIVVDDGSTDNTATVLQHYGVVVLSHPQNQGKGAALRTGMDYALRHGARAVITLDADGQHDPQELPQFLKHSSADLVIGTREHTLKSTPFHRYLSNSITSLILSLVAKQRIRDSQSGYRLLSARVMRTINLVTHRYETESEILIKAGRRGFSIDALPIQTVYSRENISHIQPLRDTWRFIVLIFRSFFW